MDANDAPMDAPMDDDHQEPIELPAKLVGTSVTSDPETQVETEVHMKLDFPDKVPASVATNADEYHWARVVVDHRDGGDFYHLDAVEVSDADGKGVDFVDPDEIEDIDVGRMNEVRGGRIGTFWMASKDALPDEAVSVVVHPSGFDDDPATMFDAAAERKSVPGQFDEVFGFSDPNT